MVLLSKCSCLIWPLVSVWPIESLPCGLWFKFRTIVIRCQCHWPHWIRLPCWIRPRTLSCMLYTIISSCRVLRISHVLSLNSTFVTSNTPITRFGCVWGFNIFFVSIFLNIRLTSDCGAYFPHSQHNWKADTKNMPLPSLAVAMLGIYYDICW